MNFPENEVGERLSKIEGYLESDPNNLRLLEEAFDHSLRLGNYQKAVLFVGRAIDLSKNSPNFQFKKGMLALILEEYSEASEIFSSLGKQGIDSPVISYNLAYAQLFNGHAEEAFAELEKIKLEDLSQVPNCLILKGRALYHLGRYEEALEAIKAHLSHFPADINAFSLEAMVLLDSGESVQAKKMAEQALVLREIDPEAHLVLGSVALEQQAAETANVHFGRSIQLNPKLGRAWSGLGFSALLEKKPDDALQCFEKAVTYMTDHPGTWHGLAWSKILKGDWVAARKAIDTAMDLDRNFADNHGTLALLAIFEGHAEGAEAAIKRALRLDPSSPSALFARSLLLSKSGRTDASMQLVGKLVNGVGLGDNAALVENASQFVAGFWSAPKKHS